MKHLALPKRLPRTKRSITAVVVASLLLVGVLAAAREATTRPTTVTAYFHDSTGVYAGDEVRILGVPVGRIDKITPEKDRVKLVLHLDHGVKAPADAKAAIVAPSLVSGRYVQLAPQYTGGATLASGSVIPDPRTAVPVEWDQIKGELNDLAVALGPQGANKNGSLNRLVTTGAKVLDGQGETINQTVHDLSEAVQTLNNGSGDIFGTVQNLEIFVKALAGSNQQIVALDQNLGTVSGVLAQDRQALRRLLKVLAVAVTKVDRFVQDNGDQLNTTVSGLGDVTKIIAKDQDDLAQILHAGPTAIKGLYEAYYKKDNAIDAAFALANLSNPAQLICGAIGAVSLTNPTATLTMCKTTLGPLLDLLAGDPNKGDGLLAYLQKNFGVNLP